MSRRIQAPFRPQPHLKGSSPPPSAKLSFSFVHLNERFPFLLSEGGPDYPAVLLARLRDLCSWTSQELLSSRSKSVRCHDIDWDHTSEPAGFSHLNATLRSQITPYQLSVSTSRVLKNSGSSAEARSNTPLQPSKGNFSLWHPI